MSQDYCPNCKAQLKDSMFGTNKMLAQSVTDVINAANEKETLGYCNKCGDDLFVTSLSKLRGDIKRLKHDLATSYQIAIPAITIPNPAKWEYEVLGLVTAQSVTGTGLFSEVNMTISDALGKESESMNKKIAEAEIVCVNRLRDKTVEMGGNAIVALNIDYSEIGSLRGMLMVCCTGTAIKITNTTILNIGVQKALTDISNYRRDLNIILAVCKPYESLS